MSQHRGGLWKAWQLTWGMPQTVAGFLVASRMPGQPRGSYRGERIVYWKRDKGMSLGLFLFLPESERARIQDGQATFLLKHEYGHAVQSALLGPLYLPVVGLSSLAWSNVPALESWRERHGCDYYDFVTERTASFLGGARR